MTLILSFLPSLLRGFQTTLFIFFATLIASLPLGLIVSLGRLYGPNWLKKTLAAFIYVMRGTPLLLQLMFIFFGLPQIGLILDRTSAALLAFILNYAAYLAEIFRGGVLAVPIGQTEAYRVLGLPKTKGFLKVILPQVFALVLPSLGNEIITLVKDTSLVYILGMTELLKAGQIAANESVSLLPFIVVGLFYLATSALINLLLNQLERRFPPAN